MAFLRETVRSLRAYFIIVAIMSGAVNLVSLLIVPVGVNTVLSVVGLGFCVALFYVGVRLRQLLVTSLGRITGVLIAGAAYLGVLLLFDLISGQYTGVVGVLIGLLMTWYLLKNVRRLAAESQAATSATG